MGRLDWVTVATSRGNITIPCASRDTLLREIRRIDSAKSIRAAFESVGASSLVKLSLDDKRNLVGLLNFWSTEVSIPRLPEGIWDLRNALVEDVDDTTPPKARRSRRRSTFRRSRSAYASGCSRRYRRSRHASPQTTRRPPESSEAHSEHERGSAGPPRSAARFAAARASTASRFLA